MAMTSTERSTKSRKNSVKPADVVIISTKLSVEAKEILDFLTVAGVTQREVIERLLLDSQTAAYATAESKIATIQAVTPAECSTACNVKYAAIVPEDETIETVAYATAGEKEAMIKQEKVLAYFATYGGYNGISKSGLAEVS